MNFTVPPAVLQHRVWSGLSILVILVLGFVSSAIAEGMTFGASASGIRNNENPASFAEKDELTLRDAAILALQRNPELASFAREKRALEGATLQAGLLRNPELSVNIENAGNIQPLVGDVNSSKNVAQEVVQQNTTIKISQLIELGGKRAARVTASLLGEELAVQDYEARRVELVARVANVFIEVLAGQAQLRFAEEGMNLAQQVADTVGKRVRAGKVPPIEEVRIGVALSTARIALMQAQRDLVAARKRLALLWGNSSPQFSKVLGDLESAITLPGFEILLERALASPAALRAVKNIEQRKALLEVEQTKRIPNLTISGGVIQHAALGGTTPVVGLAIPLPLFDRNQGNVAEANQRVDKAIDEHSAVELRLKTELMQAYESLYAAQSETAILRDEIIPAARSAFAATNKGYELGKFGFLEVLDAQRTLFQNQVLYARALANYQRLVNEIERLIAAPIDGVSAGIPDRTGIHRNSADKDLRSGL